MTQRIKLFVFSDFLQATILKKVNDKENEAIVVTVYGYTPDGDAHIEFSYDVEFCNERDRDSTFEEITQELLLEDVKKIIETSNIPIKP